MAPGGAVLSGKGSGTNDKQEWRVLLMLGPAARRKKNTTLLLPFLGHQALNLSPHLIH